MGSGEVIGFDAKFKGDVVRVVMRLETESTIVSFTLIGSGLR